MKLLAIDTTSTVGGAALLEDRQVLVEETFPLHRSASTELLPAIDRLFHQQSLERGDLDAIAVALGPGSFTGIRIGLATAQGIAAAGSLPVFGVSSLAALAAQADSKLPWVGVCRPARADEFYFGLFTFPKGGPTEKIPEGRYRQGQIDRFVQSAPAGGVLLVEGKTVTPRPAAVGWVASYLDADSALPGGHGLQPRFYPSLVE